MSEPAEDLHSFDSQPNAQVVDPDSDRTRSEFLDSWAQHLSAGQPADLPPVDASTGIQRVFLAHDTVVDYKPVEITKRSFALGADYLTAGNHRSFTERIGDFAQAAAHRLADPEEQKAYIDGQINKVIGIGEGLNGAKENVKATAAAALKAGIDGTAVEFLSHPNAINDSIFHTAANALSTIPKDPQAIGKASETLGNSIVKANNYFNVLTPEQQGKLLGEMMFFGLAPEGEPEALGELQGSAGKLEHEIVNSIDVSADNAEKVRQLVKLSYSNESEARQLTEDIDTEFDAESILSFKNPETIAEKAERPQIRERKPWFGVEHIRDALRFRTVLGSLKDLPTIAKKLKDSNFAIIKVDTERLLHPSDRGWRMAAFDLRTLNGQLVEYQVVPKELEAVDKETHDIYEKWRTKDLSVLSKIESKAMKRDYDRAKKLSGNAWKQYLKRTGQTEKNVTGYIYKIREVLSGQPDT